MQVTIENTSNLGRKLNITVPVETIETKVSEKLKKIAGQVKLDGFRPGKVPQNVVKQRFGQSARQEVIGEILQETLFKAIEEEKLYPAAMPEIESIKAEENSPLEYSAIFEVYPEIELKDFSSLTAETITAEVKDSDIDEMLDNIRKQRVEYAKVDRKGQKDDQLVINFEGFKDGEAFEGGKGENVNLVLGSNSFIPGFEDQLIGKSAGDKAELNLTFPESYHVEDLAGKPVVFKVEVLEVKEPKVPELDEEFVKSMGVESGDLNEFKAQIKDHMERELKQAIKTKQKQKLFEQLLEVHQFDVPESLIENEIKAIYKQYMPKHEPTKEQIENAPENLKEESKKRVATGLVIAEIIKKHELKADQDKVLEHLQEMAQAYDQPEQMISWYYSDKQRLAGVEAIILEEQVYDTICEKATCTEKTLSYSEVMKPEQQ